MPTVPDIHRRGTRADQAVIAAPPLTVGTLYFVTDEGVTERWDGSGWEGYSGPGTGAAPTAHAASHENAGGDEISVTGLSGLLADGQTPLAHTTSHQSAGSDPLVLDTLAAPTDVTTLNASAGAHGLLPKLSGTATDFLNGAGAWTVPAGGTPSAHATSHHTGGSDPITALSGSVITTGTVASARLPARIGAVGIIIDGAGSVITTGVKGFVEVPFACTITAATLLSTDAASTAGSIVIDIWKDTYANYPPVVGDSITASAKPTLSAANKSRDTTLSGWSTSISAGDVLGVTVDSATTVTRVLLSLTVQAT